MPGRLVAPGFCFDQSGCFGRLTARDRADVSNADAGKTVRSMSASAKPAPIGVKKWAPDRVKALLARFGQ